LPGPPPASVDTGGAPVLLPVVPPPVVLPPVPEAPVEAPAVDDATAPAVAEVETPLPVDEPDETAPAEVDLVPVDSIEMQAVRHERSVATISNGSVRDFRRGAIPSNCAERRDPSRFLAPHPELLPFRERVPVRGA
jgi:hypothetical protein